MFGFSIWIFKTRFNLLPDLLNTGFAIIETGLFYGGEQLGSKNMQIPDLYWHDGDVYIIEETPVLSDV